MSDLSERLRALTHPHPDTCLQPTAFLDCKHESLRDRVAQLGIMDLPRHKCDSPAG